jgi:PPOX class probable F420-dependent enzyme
MAKLNDDDIKLLEDTNLAHVATINPDGSPHLTPVWVDTDGEAVLFNTAEGRVKHRNLVRESRISVEVVDRNDDYRLVRVSGRAELVHDGADAHIDKLAKKYLDADSYPFRKKGEVRVIVRVVPD